MELIESALRHTEYVEPPVILDVRRIKSSDLVYELNDRLSEQYVREHTTFLDVTEDEELLEATLQTVARNYQPLANPDEPLSVDDVHELLCKDGNEVKGRSTVLAAVLTLPEDKGRIVVATMRFVYANNNLNNEPPKIAEEDLVNADWEQIAGEDGLESLATVGRYCLIPVMRRIPHIPGYLTGELLRQGFEIGKDKYPPIKNFAAVMPRRVVMNVTAGGVNVVDYPMSLKEVPGYPLGANLRDPQHSQELRELLNSCGSEEEYKSLLEAVDANAYYYKFRKYWLQHLDGHSDPPKLYKFITE